MSRGWYITHFYCLAVEAGFYSDVVECLRVDPATWVRFPARAGKVFSLYDISSLQKITNKICFVCAVKPVLDGHLRNRQYGLLLARFPK